jgi:predicted nucleic acid-binding protein
MEQVTAMLERLKQRRGYSFQAIAVDWPALTEPFAKRIHGHNQVTDAYLLGLAVRENVILVTMDKALLHLAGNEQSKHVLLLGN